MINWLKQLFWQTNDLLGGKPPVKRSPQWSKLRKDYLEDFNTCAVCGKKSSFLKPLELHHKVPYHIDPSRELDHSNLICLCRPCHYMFGHCFLNWKCYNRNIKEDSIIVNSIIKNAQKQTEQQVFNTTH